MTITLHIESVEQDKAFDLVKRKYLYGTTKIDEQKRLKKQVMM